MSSPFDPMELAIQRIAENGQDVIREVARARNSERASAIASNLGTVIEQLQQAQNYALTMADRLPAR